MGRRDAMYFDRFEKEAEMLLADLQSNGDIQISSPEESILKTRRRRGHPQAVR